MNTNVLIGGLLLLIAIGLFVANTRITNERLSRLSSIASILAFALAVIVFAFFPLINPINNATLEEDKAAVNVIINKEVNAALKLELTTLPTLYTPDAVVIDRHGTPNDASDDSVLEGWENIKRHYIGFHEFYEPVTMSLVDVNVDVIGNNATVTHKGAIINDVYREDIGIYTLEKRGGRWLITILEFGLK